jgi:hypothetical protein
LKKSDRKEIREQVLSSQKPGFLDNTNAGASRRSGGTQWNPTFLLGSAALHPTYKWYFFILAKVLLEKPGFTGAPSSFKLIK